MVTSDCKNCSPLFVMCSVLNFIPTNSLSILLQGVRPLVESILKSDLERFAKYAKSVSANKNIPQKK